MSQTWRYDEDRTYRGYRHSSGDLAIDIELAEYGPTHRQGVKVLRTLTSGTLFSKAQFGWGHKGGGANAAAHEILADAFGEPAPAKLRNAFSEDVLSQFSTEWRLRRGAVLRWALGWGAQHGALRQLPAILCSLPPVDAKRYGPRPQHVSDAWHSKFLGPNAKDSPSQ